MIPFLSTKTILHLGYANNPPSTNPEDQSQHQTSTQRTIQLNQHVFHYTALLLNHMASYWRLDFQHDGSWHERSLEDMKLSISLLTSRQRTPNT